MLVKQYLGEMGYTKKEKFTYEDILLSEAYEKSGVLVVVDAGGICGAPFCAWRKNLGGYYAFAK